MADLVPLKVASQAGCKRDGTLLEGKTMLIRNGAAFSYARVCRARWADTAA